MTQSSDLSSPKTLIDESEYARLVDMDRRVRIKRARLYAQQNNILMWGKMTMPEKFYLPFCPPLHNHFIDVRGEPFVNDEAPRNHAKTLIKCTLIMMFQALEETMDFRHYLNVQNTQDKALTVNRSMKPEFETNEILLALYGDMVGKEKWTDSQFVLKNETIFTAISANESIRGMNYRNIRPDYIVVDDLYNDEDLNNPESTEKKNKWFWSSLFPARAKSKRCSIHIQGTAINNEDLLHQLKKKPRWKSRTFQALPGWDGNPNNRVEPLWPELNSFDSLILDKEDMGSVIWFREMQNERREEANAIIKSGWIQEYDPDELVFDLRFQYNGCVLGVDPSIGAKVENDFTAIVKIYKGRYADGKGDFFYIDEIWNEHISLDQRVNLLQRIQDMQPSNRKIQIAYIEAIAGFKDFTAEVKRRATLPVREVDKVLDKITNLENKSKFFENKKVFINKNIQPKLKDMLIYQLTTNHPKYDDLRDAALLPLEMVRVDAMSYAD